MTSSYMHIKAKKREREKDEYGRETTKKAED